MAYLIILMISGMVSLTHTKPVMVSFGTNQGPIVPAAPRSTTVNPLAPRSAAPVFEQEENAPPPPQYRPPTPHQYRTDIYSSRPNPNLILGTPLDIKYTPALKRAHLLNKAKLQQSEGFGAGYTGPQEFDVQVYEIERATKKSVSPAKAFVDQYKPQKRDDQVQTGNYETTRRQGSNYQFHYQTHQPQQEYQSRRENPQSYEFTGSNNFVPQIGIVYSSGIRYYIPQINNQQQDDTSYQYHHQY